MCGVIGCASAELAAPVLAAGLSFLQHRGQDAAGIATMSGSRLFIEKGYGVAGDVFGKSKRGSQTRRCPGTFGNAAVLCQSTLRNGACA